MVPHTPEGVLLYQSTVSRQREGCDCQWEELLRKSEEYFRVTPVHPFRQLGCKEDKLDFTKFEAHISDQCPVPLVVARALSYRGAKVGSWLDKVSCQATHRRA